MQLLPTPPRDWQRRFNRLFNISFGHGPFLILGGFILCGLLILSLGIKGPRQEVAADPASGSTGRGPALDDPPSSPTHNPTPIAQPSVPGSQASVADPPGPTLVSPSASRTAAPAPTEIPKSPTPISTSTSTPTQTPDTRILYTVLPGDSLLAVAQRAGVSVVALAGANGLNRKSQIHPNQILEIPPQRGPQPAVRVTPIGDGAAVIAHTPDYAVVSPPSISAAKIDSVLKEYGSPLAGRGATFYTLGVKYGIDPAYALAFFIHESSAGTEGIARVTESIGNRRMIDGAPEYEGFTYYPSWEASIEDWYQLISQQYVSGWHLQTVSEIIPVYAPTTDDNDVPAYISGVQALVHSWNTARGGPPKPGYAPRVTRGLAGRANLLPRSYRVATAFGHYPLGGVSYGLDISATVGVSQTAPVGGVVEDVERSCLPGVLTCGHGWGNHVWWKSAETGHHILFAYLGQIDPAVHFGAKIQAGAALGATGATGYAAAPLAHIEVNPNAMADAGSVEPSLEFPWLSCRSNSPQVGALWGTVVCSPPPAPGGTKPKPTPAPRRK